MIAYFKPAALSAALLLALASGVEAQSMTLTALALTGGDGDRVTPEGPANAFFDTERPIGTLDCASPSAVILELQANNVPTSARYLDFWIGPSDANCADSTARVGDTAVCYDIGFDETLSSTSMRDFDLPLSAFTAVSALRACMPNVVANLKLWALASETTTTTGTPIGSASIPVTIDTQAPPAPGNLEGGDGESSLPLSWDAAGDEQTVFEYCIYVDTGTATTIGGDAGDFDAGLDDGGTTDDGGTIDDAGTDAGGGFDAGPTGTDGGASGDGGGTTPTECGSGMLVSGTIPTDRGLEPVRCVSEDVTSQSLDPDSIGLAIGESAAVAVAAVDRAGNVGPLSNVVCVERVSTVGFCDRLGGCEDTGCSCVAAGASRSAGTPYGALASLALLVAVVSIRRRRRS